VAAQPREFQGTLDHTLFTKPEDLHGESPLAIGGKAAGLLRLHAAGAPVPPWVVLPADLAVQFHPDTAETRLTLDATFAELSPNGEGLAVRSSGLAEDQSGASAAGIYETLFCASAAELPEAIDAVLNSARATRASAYCGGSDSDAMAVILQRRITPTLSGVAFSAHPSRARYDRVLIEAVLGECGALVDGTATPSRFEVDIASGTIAQAETGAQGPDRLDGELAAALLGWLLKLEDTFDAALDIEWAADASGLWLLQARPITRLALDTSLRPPVPATSWFLDQRFHEPIHPITRGTLLPLIVRTGIEDALQLRGIAVPTPLTFDFGGQVYVSLEAYHRLLRNLPVWLLTPDLRQLYPAGKGPGRLPGPGLLWTGLPVLWRERKRVLGNLRAWDRYRDGLGARLAAIPEAKGSDDAAWYEAWAQLDALTEEFLCLHRWSIVLADYAYNAFLLLTRPLPRALREHLRTGLLKQVRLVTAEANTAREAACGGDRATVKAFLCACGHRSSSLDYAAPTWAEIAPFAGVVPQPGLAELRPTPSPPSRNVLARLLEMREEQRFHWERILAQQRKRLLSAGRALEAKGLLAERALIWWLEWDELRQALTDGRAADPAHIAQRRREHRINVPVRRPTHLGPWKREGEEMTATVLRGVGASPGVARGTAQVFQQLNALPEHLPEGCVLVLPCLDPAWTPVLRHVAGLVIERGGLLSHAAIIARDYGIPLVIGVPEATERITAGAMIEVDGDSGVVRTG
jgi:pyruvate,water dikinase